ncbi:hypothetical protein [Cupriavidus sp. SK-3]|uniref:hypothetical protein n=1 Tax=Cupriavidus sp. SK-3 TaxID=1470558 RepID=UPI00190F0AD7|nr:hypothetical protein [Cupriavidus sp. SK-3]
MAHTIINGVALSCSTAGPTLVDQAEATIEELDDWILLLRRAAHALRPLELLRPGGDD